MPDSLNHWWLIAAVLVALELASGTFYLLMLALGALAGQAAQWAGLGFDAQAAVVAAVSAALVGVLYLGRRRRGTASVANRDINLDIGETLQVDAWDADGRARVRYRGSDWSARSHATATPLPGRHRIVAIDGSTLLLEPVDPAREPR